MNIIIDTHIFLWLLSDPKKIESKTSLLENTDNNIYLSSMSIAEIMIKHSIGKLNFNFDALYLAKQMGVEILSFKGTDAIYLRVLPLHHKDPFDRMIIAQALANDYFIMTVDNKFSIYDCKLL